MKKKYFAASILAAGLCFGARTANERLGDAADVMNEIMATPDKGVPEDLLNKSACVIVVPGLKKGAFIVGAKYGKGFFVCRREHRGWSAPAAIRVEGGSFGFQIGGSETDVVMLVMNEGGIKKLLADKFTVGADASVAAGPVGRDSSAQTDAQLHAEMLTYSRSRGAFAGIALQGATLRPDDDWNEELYGKKLTEREIILGPTPPPAAASRFLATLNKYSGRRTK
jgi:lipid-binding SYLF domain-containing protein